MVGSGIDCCCTVQNAFFVFVCFEVQYNEAHAAVHHPYLHRYIVVVRYCSTMYVYLRLLLNPSRIEASVTVLHVTAKAALTPLRVCQRWRHMLSTYNIAAI